MFASIVILTRNRLKQLDHCLQSLRAQYYRDFEVVVVDTGSTDGTPEWIRRERPFDPLRLIETQGGSFANARNEGVEAAAGDWVAFLDDDCIAAPDWLECVAAVPDRYDAVGGLTLPAKLLPLPSWWHPEMGWLVGWAVPEHLRRSTGSHFYPSTSNLAARREILARHEFQEIEASFEMPEGVYRGGREDAELWRRLRRIGYRTLFLPEMMVYHDVPANRFDWKYLSARARADGRTLWERERPNEVLEDACRQVVHYGLTWPRRLLADRPERALRRLWFLRQWALINAAVGNLSRGGKVRALAVALGRAGRQVVRSEFKTLARPRLVRREQRKHPHNPLSKSPGCLGVVAFGFLGDMVIIQPACRAFREAHPESRMVLVTHPMGDLVHKHEEYWDGRILYHGKPNEPPRRERLDAMCKELEEHKVTDLAILYYHDMPPELLYHTTNAGILTFDDDVGLPRRMWYDLATARLPKDMEGQEILNLANLLEWWGPLAPLRPYQWKVSDEEQRDARALLRLDSATPRNILALHTGSVLPYKMWPLRHWMELAGWLGEVENLDLVFLGDERCFEGASQIIRANRLNAINLCGRLSVRQLAAVLAESSLLITADSGPKHVAFATGTPTIALYGHSAPDRWGALWDRPKHAALAGGNADLTPEEAHGLPVDYLMSRILPEHVYDKIRCFFEHGAFLPTHREAAAGFADRQL
jgi:ADP-heptose:LPS heptosyltransferase/glycosyltransferase involved in cell wall biosynthesis